MRISDWSSDVCSSDLKGWRMLWQKMNPGTAVPALGDSALQGMVSGIVVEKEQIGSNRYIASLGVLFDRARSEEHTSELQSLMRISYAVFCLKKKTLNTSKTLIT